MWERTGATVLGFEERIGERESLDLVVFVGVEMMNFLKKKIGFF